MRVLLVNENFPPADLGGTETSVQQTAMGLAEEGHEVHVLGRYPGERPRAAGEPYAFHGVPLRSPRTPSGAILQEYGLDPRRMRRRAEGLTRALGPFDLVVANNGISAMALSGLRSSGVRALVVRSYIYTCPLGHGYCLDASGATSCESRYECARHRHAGAGIERAKAVAASLLYGSGFERLRRAPRSFDVILADSAFVRRNAEASGMRVNDVVYEAIDVHSRTIERAADPEPIALFAGRVSVEKGFFSLLEAFADARAKVPRARLLVAGAGPQLPAAKARARALGLAESVDFLGRVPNEALPRLYARAWCVAVPSLWPEPFGIVAAEAALCGAPVLASRVGGIPEALAIEEAGNTRPHALLPPGDRVAWSEALARALEAPAEVPARLREAVAARVDRRAVARRIVRACATKNA